MSGNIQHEKTEDNIKLVTALASYGVPIDQIAASLDISKETLMEFYREDINKSQAKINASIGQTLYQKAKQGDTNALIHWTKTQMGWADKSKK
jgi:orotate phosphoribosyltransferase-like protein